MTHTGKRTARTMIRVLFEVDGELFDGLSIGSSDFVDGSVVVEVVVVV